MVAVHSPSGQLGQDVRVCLDAQGLGRPLQSALLLACFKKH